MHQTLQGRRRRNWQTAPIPTSLRCLTRIGVITVVALATIASATPLFGSAAMAAGGHGSDVVVTPLRQSDDSAGAETTPETARDDDSGRMATIAAMLEQQGERSAEALARVASVKLTNPLPMPEPTVDVAAEQTAEANAAAAVATEVARSVQATVEASATSAATTQREEQRAAAAASATAAAATPVAVATEVAVVAATRADDDPTAPAIGLSLLSVWLAQDKVSALPIMATPMLLGLVGVLIWRRQQEPFVLKAKPEKS